MESHQAPPVAPPPASQKYIHLIMPIVTATLICTNRDITSHILNPKNATPMNSMLLVAASSIPTHFVASNLYPPNRPEPTPEESIRFTRKHEAYRALVLASYGRLFGTPFRPQFLIADFLCSYAIGYVIGERPVGMRQRRSEFFVAFLWILASWMLMAIVPPSMETVYFWLAVGDRAIWRAAYLALVDDVIGLLAYPNVRTVRGRVTLVLAQAFTITSLVWFGLSWIKRYNEGYFRST